MFQIAQAQSGGEPAPTRGQLMAAADAARERGDYRTALRRYARVDPAASPATPLRSHRTSPGGWRWRTTSEQTHTRRWTCSASAARRGPARRPGPGGSRVGRRSLETRRERAGAHPGRDRRNPRRGLRGRGCPRPGPSRPGARAEPGRRAGRRGRALRPGSDVRRPRRGSPAVRRFAANRSHHLLADSQYAEAAAVSGHAAEGARAAGFAEVESVALTNQAEALLRLGRLDEAVRCCDAVFALSALLGTARTAGALVVLAAVHQRRHASEQARAALEHAVSLSRRGHGDRQVRPVALAALARMLAATSWRWPPRSPRRPTNTRAAPVCCPRCWQPDMWRWPATRRTPPGR